MTQKIIEAAWNDRTLLDDAATRSAILQVIEQLDAGVLRVAEKQGDAWKVNEW